jgi:hypothetical protein
MSSTPFDQQLAAIENVFGVPWLSGTPPQTAVKSTRKRPRGKARPHQLQAAWRELRSLYSGQVIFAPVDLRRSAALTLIKRVATVVPSLPRASGFENVILPRLRRPSDFESALHECEVAYWFAKDGFDVEFLPPESLIGKKSPDLKVGTRVGTIEVECKLKDPIKPNILTQSSRVALGERCLSVLKKLDLDIELFALIIGRAEEHNLEAAFARIESLASEGVRGPRVETNPAMFVEITNSPINIPVSTLEEYRSWAVARSCAVNCSQTSPLGNGRSHFSKHRGMGIMVLDGHTFDQVDDSISKASRQLSPEKLGIVVINVDLSGGSSVDVWHEMYLRLLERALSHRTWGEERNTRIGAVVLKLSVTEEVAGPPVAYTRSGSMYLCITKPGIDCQHGGRPSKLFDCLLRA